VAWVTTDQVRMGGFYHAGSPGRITWDGFARSLVRSGQGVLVFAARGHGESRKLTGGQSVTYESFVREDWKRMPDDLGGAIQFLIKTYGLKSERIAVGGASLGANVALLYAAHSESVPAVMLLSSGIEYAGLNIDRPFTLYGKRPLLLAASPGDRYAFESMQSLAVRRNDALLKLIEGPGSQHGVNMLNPETTARILEWTKGIN
jgi:alpha-beta hydrolase superfamily lysophospholipase